MTRIMYDSVNVESLPSGTTMAAGYVDGLYANMGQLTARFPAAIKVDIVVDPNHSDRGRVLDIEAGDASPHAAPGWVLRRRIAGVDPTVYCNAFTWPLVREAFDEAGVPEPHYWIAHYDGDPTIPVGAVAKQYSQSGDYDISSVADYWPGIDPPEEKPLTLEDAQLIAQTLLSTKLASPFRNDPDGKPAEISVSSYLEWMDAHYDSTMRAIADSAAAIRELNAAVVQISQQIAALSKAEQAPGV